MQLAKYFTMLGLKQRLADVRRELSGLGHVLSGLRDLDIAAGEVFLTDGGSCPRPEPDDFLRACGSFEAWSELNQLSPLVSPHRYALHRRLCGLHFAETRLEYRPLWDGPTWLQLVALLSVVWIFSLEMDWPWLPQRRLATVVSLAHSWLAEKAEPWLGEMTRERVLFDLAVFGQQLISLVLALVHLPVVGCVTIPIVSLMEGAVMSVGLVAFRLNRRWSRRRRWDANSGLRIVFVLRLHFAWLGLIEAAGWTGTAFR